MFVKVYSYQIQEDKIEDYLEVQKKVLKIYCKYIEVEAIHLQNQNYPTKWIEMSIYSCEEEEYHKRMQLINEDKEIQGFFQAFQAFLVPGTEIMEENYKKIFLERIW